MAQEKQPKEMTALEAVEAIAKWHNEHDLDCEEEIGSDRCVPCLAEAAVTKLKAEDPGTSKIGAEAAAVLERQEREPSHGQADSAPSPGTGDGGSE